MWRAQLLFFALSLPLAAGAQNTSGVFGPEVQADHQSVEYRLGANLERDAFAHRFHYQRARGDNLRWRLIAQYREQPGERTKFQFVQAELLWQQRNITDNWMHALRFDLRTGPGDLAEQIGIDWTNQWTLSAATNIRFVMLASKSLDGALSGVLFQSRAHVQHRLSNDLSVALSAFSVLGTTSEDWDFSDQAHQIGPTMSYKLGPDWQLQLGLLRGFSAAPSDLTARLWLRKTL